MIYGVYHSVRTIQIEMIAVMLNGRGLLFKRMKENVLWLAI